MLHVSGGRICHNKMQCRYGFVSLNLAPSVWLELAAPYLPEPDRMREITEKRTKIYLIQLAVPIYQSQAECPKSHTKSRATMCS